MMDSPTDDMDVTMDAKTTLMEFKFTLYETKIDKQTIFETDHVL